MKGGLSALSKQVTKAEIQDSGLNIHTTHLCDAHGLTVRRGTEFCEMQMGVGMCENQEQFAGALRKPEKEAGARVYLWCEVLEGHRELLKQAS